MLPGFNHNIKYKNKIFHVQTEDNGEENPLIVSHIFIGGNIVATKKTDYSHLLGCENILNAVRTIMENQHKEIIKELITGKYDSHPLVSQEIDKSEGTSVSNNALPINRIEGNNIQHQEIITGKPRTESPFKPVGGTSTFTVFGEGTISEESLDKIILKFLKENKQS